MVAITKKKKKKKKQASTVEIVKSRRGSHLYNVGMFVFSDVLLTR